MPFSLARRTGAVSTLVLATGVTMVLGCGTAAAAGPDRSERAPERPAAGPVVPKQAGHGASSTGRRTGGAQPKKASPAQRAPRPGGVGRSVSKPPRSAGGAGATPARLAGLLRPSSSSWLVVPPSPSSSSRPAGGPAPGQAPRSPQTGAAPAGPAPAVAPPRTGPVLGPHPVRAPLGPRPGAEAVPARPVPSLQGPRAPFPVVAAAGATPLRPLGGVTAPAPAALAAPAPRVPAPRARRLPPALSEGLPALASTAVQTVAARPQLPLGIALVVVVFLLVQGRIDRRDPKLALARLDEDVPLDFAPAVELLAGRRLAGPA